MKTVITKAMIDAGVSAFYAADRRFDTAEEIVERIYVAMERALYEARKEREATLA